MIITRTPFRISFFGGGTDYPVWYRQFGGAVLSTTIDKCCYITCRRLPPFFEYHSRISYSKVENVATNNAIKHPDPVKKAFITEQAAQCGYYCNGMIMITNALLLRSPHPSEAELLEALRYNLCRCGAHIEIMRAAMRAAGALAEAQD